MVPFIISLESKNFENCLCIVDFHKTYDSRGDEMNRKNMVSVSTVNCNLPRSCSQGSIWWKKKRGFGLYTVGLIK